MGPLAQVAEQPGAAAEPFHVLGPSQNQHLFESHSKWVRTMHLPVKYVVSQTKRAYWRLCFFPHLGGPGATTYPSPLDPKHFIVVEVL